MGIEINIVKSSGKPIEKLIQVVSRGAGILYEGKRIRKLADAKAYKIEVLEIAKANARIKSHEIEQEYLEIASNRLVHQQINGVQNIECIVNTSRDILAKEQSVSEEPVGNDWATRFFSIAEDISDVDMQTLWSRVLAGEVKQPGSFSLRSLETLRNMSKEDAAVFKNFGEVSVLMEDFAFLTSKILKSALAKKRGLNYKKKLLLEELGLVATREIGVPNSEGAMRPSFIGSQIGDTSLIVTREGGVPYTGEYGYLYTQSGYELLRLLSFTPKMELLQLAVSAYKGLNVQIHYAVGRYYQKEDIPTSELIQLPLSKEELKAKMESEELSKSLTDLAKKKNGKHL